MFKFIRKYQKQILAVFSVGLMIQFVINTGYGRGAGGHRGETVIGKIEGKPLYSSELEQSRREWNALNHYFVVPDPTSGRTLPFTSYVFGPELTQAIEQKPELFMLLR